MEHAGESEFYVGIKMACQVATTRKPSFRHI